MILRKVSGPLIASVLIIGAVAGGCSSTSSTQTPSQTPTQTVGASQPSASTAETPGASASTSASTQSVYEQALSLACPTTTKKTFNVGMVRWTPSDIFFNGVQLGEQMEKDRIQKDCGVTINWNVSGADDVTPQVNALQADLSTGVDGVDLVPWDGSAFTATLNQLASQKLPVVVHNSIVPSAPQTFVAFDNVKAGNIAGTAAIKILDTNRGQAWRQQDGVFVELRCILSLSADIGRDKGYHQVMDPIIAASGGKIHLETRVVACDDSKARQAMDDLITKYGSQVLAAFAIDGDSGFGAESAIISHSMNTAKTDAKYIPVVAVDGSEAEMTLEAKGQMTTTAEQPAIAEGVITERLLYYQMATGTLLDNAPATETDVQLPGYDGAPWQPIKIGTDSTFTGPWYEIQTFDNTSIPLDDHWHWANIQDQTKTGQWPHYTSDGCVSGCPSS